MAGPGIVQRSFDTSELELKHGRRCRNVILISRLLKLLVLATLYKLPRRDRNVGGDKLVPLKNGLLRYYWLSTYATLTYPYFEDGIPWQSGV